MEEYLKKQVMAVCDKAAQEGQLFVMGNTALKPVDFMLHATSKDAVKEVAGIMDGLKAEAGAAGGTLSDEDAMKQAVETYLAKYPTLEAEKEEAKPQAKAEEKQEEPRKPVEAKEEAKPAEAPKAETKTETKAPLQDEYADVVKLESRYIARLRPMITLASTSITDAARFLRLKCDEDGKELTVMAFNDVQRMNMTLPVLEGSTDMDALIDAKKFWQIVQGMKGDVTILASAKRCMIKCGKLAYKLPVGSTKDKARFEKIASEKTKASATLRNSELARLLSMCMPFTSSSKESSKTSDGVNIAIGKKGVVATATNGRLVMRVEGAAPRNLQLEESANVTLPPESVALIAGVAKEHGKSEDTEVVMSVGSSLATFEWHDTILATKKLAGKYPNAEQAFPDVRNGKAKVSREGLANMLKNVMLVNVGTVTFRFSEDGLTAVTENPEDNTRCEDELECRGNANGMFSCNPAYLMSFVTLPSLPSDLSLQFAAGVGKAPADPRDEGRYMTMGYEDEGVNFWVVGMRAKPVPQKPADDGKGKEKGKKK